MTTCLHVPDDQTLTVQNPSEEKYRRINLANAAIQSRVARLPSSVTFFELLGFQVSQDAVMFGSIAAAPCLDIVGNEVGLTCQSGSPCLGICQLTPQCLLCVSMQKDADGNGLYLPADKVNIEVLHLAGSELNNASTNPFFGAL